jgi:hypothetical protein
VAGVDDVVEILLAQLLVVSLPETDGQEVDRVRLEAREVFLAEAWVEEHVADEAVIFFEVVGVRRARKDGHLLVNLPAEGGRQGVHRLNDLVVGHRARAALCEHRGGQRGDPLFARGVGGRARVEEDAEGDERRARWLEHVCDFVAACHRGFRRDGRGLRSVRRRFLNGRGGLRTSRARLREGGREGKQSGQADEKKTERASHQLPPPFDRPTEAID